MVERLRAAQYVRMSTDRQQYSLAFQATANAEYAAARGYELIVSYPDRGVSGLSLSGRDGLKALLARIVAGDADFQVVVVYDVSRWGRFQNADEAAHYEFMCRQAGVRVEYTAEPFANDGGMLDVLMKHVKRAMAAEYVRELSEKTERVLRGLAAQGYWTGGPPPLGFRRCMVSADGAPVAVLERGERKALQGHRVVLVPGPVAEVELVRRIFRAFVIEGRSIRDIAARLNAEGERCARARPWTEWALRNLLTNEKYVGVFVLGRRTRHLKRQTVHPPAHWRRIAGCCPGLVDPKLFAMARANIGRLERGPAREVLLAELRDVLTRNGRLSYGVITRDPFARSAGLYQRRLGGLDQVYAALGYTPTAVQVRQAASARRHLPGGKPRAWRNRPSTDFLLTALAALHREHGHLTAELIGLSPTTPSVHCYRRRFGSLGRAYELVGYDPTHAQRIRFRPFPETRPASAFSV